MRQYKKHSLKTPAAIGFIFLGVLYYYCHSHKHSTSQSFEGPKSIRKDFQAGAAKAYVFNHFKENDSKAMRHLLFLVKDFKSYQHPTVPLSITDLGGGSGEMLKHLLPLAAQILIHINEPDQERREAYISEAKKHPQVTVGQVIPERMQNVEFPKSDIILASHSLYYNTEQWLNENLKRPSFLDRVLNSLQAGGVFCVILQSSASTGLNKMGGGKMANLENLEDFVYPLITLQTEGKAIENHSRSSFANAELLLSALERHKKYNPSLFWRCSPPIVSTVPLGKINFNKNTLTGKYDQSPEVTQILNFYSRGLYCPEDEQTPGFTGEQQREFLNYIYTHCQDLEGHFSMVHVNKVIVILPTSLHQAFSQYENGHSAPTFSMSV